MHCYFHAFLTVKYSEESAMKPFSDEYFLGSGKLHRTLAYAFLRMQIENIKIKLQISCGHTDGALLSYAFVTELVHLLFSRISMFSHHLFTLVGACGLPFFCDFYI
ncbi:hypothetical protein ACJX0J_020411 [Zea mays]